MDTFTTMMLLHMSKKDNDAAANLYKELKKEDNGKLDIALANGIDALKDTVVYISGTDYKGIIHAANRVVSGFYPGTRYPVYVKITDHKSMTAVDSVFEYGLDQVIIKTENGDLLSLKEVFNNEYAGEDTSGYTKALLDRLIERNDVLLFNNGDDLGTPISYRFENGVTMVELITLDKPNSVIPFAEVVLTRY